MAAPERFAEMSDFSLAPQAPSIHGTKRTMLQHVPDDIFLNGDVDQTTIRDLCSTSSVSMRRFLMIIWHARSTPFSIYLGSTQSLRRTIQPSAGLRLIRY